MRFLGFEFGAPTFDFDATRLVGDTRVLKREIHDEGYRRYRFAAPLEPDAFGDLRQGAIVDAHFNAHFDGGAFDVEWPQHLGTLPHPALALSADAAAGATVLAADMALATVALTRRVGHGGRGTADAAGEWQFVRSPSAARPKPALPWADAKEAGGILFFAADESDLGGAAAGDTLRFAQGERVADWRIARVDYGGQIAVVHFASLLAFAGAGNVADDGAAAASMLRTTPLVGRYVAVGASTKLHQIVAASTTGITVSPGLAADAADGDAVDTTPTVPARYAPDGDAQSVYSRGVLHRRTVVLEEAL